MAFLDSEDFEILVGQIVWHKADRRRMVVINQSIEIPVAGEEPVPEGEEADPHIRRKCECSYVMPDGNYVQEEFYYCEISTYRHEMDENFGDGAYHF